MDGDSHGPSHRPPSEPPGLYALLADRARRSSDGALALCAGVGLLGAGVTGLLGARWAPVALAFVCASTFGVWGIAEREASERADSLEGHALRALRLVKWIAAAVGTLAGAGILAIVLGVALGRLQS